jgi:proteasomal ATPase-associated factor 1
MVDRGREVLSAGKDGTLRLWDVGAGTQIRMAGTSGGTPVLGLAHSSTSGLAWMVLGDGALEAVDIRADEGATAVRRVAGRPVALHAIAVSDCGNFVASGARDGVVALWDVRNTGANQGPMIQWRRSTACVEDMVFSPGSSSELLVTTFDGLPYRARLSPSGREVEVVEELAGVDCDPVRGVRCGADGSLWTGADDGNLRRY